MARPVEFFISPPYDMPTLDPSNFLFPPGGKYPIFTVRDRDTKDATHLCGGPTCYPGGLTKQVADPIRITQHRKRNTQAERRKPITQYATNWDHKSKQTQRRKRCTKPSCRLPHTPATRGETRRICLKLGSKDQKKTPRTKTEENTKKKDTARSVPRWVLRPSDHQESVEKKRRSALLRELLRKQLACNLATLSQRASP